MKKAKPKMTASKAAMKKSSPQGTAVGSGTRGKSKMTIPTSDPKHQHGLDGRMTKNALK